MPDAAEAVEVHPGIAVERDRWRRLVAEWLSPFTPQPVSDVPLRPVLLLPAVPPAELRAGDVIKNTDYFDEDGWDLLLVTDEPVATQILWGIPVTMISYVRWLRKEERMTAGGAIYGRTQEPLRVLREATAAEEET